MHRTATARIFRAAFLALAVLGAGYPNHEASATMDTANTRPLPSGGRRPVLTTVTGLSAAEAEGQVTAGTHHAQHPALRAQNAGQAALVASATRPAEPPRATLLPEHANVLHAVAGAAFRQRPTDVMAFMHDGSPVTAAQVANACSRAIAVAAPAGWGTPPVSADIANAAKNLFFIEDGGVDVRSFVDSAREVSESDIDPEVLDAARKDISEKGPPKLVQVEKLEPDPVATLVGDTRARLSGSGAVTLGSAELHDLDMASVISALQGKGLTVDQINPGVLLVTEAAPSVPVKENGDQPPAGGGTGQEAGTRKEEPASTQCPYCTADPFGSAKGLSMHIRNKHPDKVPGAAA